MPVSHLDLYRLEDLGAEDPGLLDDYLTPDAIAFIEWPAALEPTLDRVAARVKIEHAGGDRRRITLADQPTVGASL
jgi:tRNA threonylcarbamoyladenosine biosynthesis protein TsaE